MSLIVSNRATEKQIAELKRLGYIGPLKLSIEAAAKLLDELFEEERLALGDSYIEFEGNYYKIY